MGILRKTAKSLLIFIVIISWLFNYPPFIYENLGGLRIWQKPAIPPEIQEARAADTVEFITGIASTTWTVPSNWTASNTIEVIGGGGGGVDDGNNGAGGGGGGGGAYAKVSNLNFNPGASVTTQVGAGGGQGQNGGDTWFNDLGGATSTACDSNVSTGQSVCAENGLTGSTSTGGAGGASSTSVGNLSYKGGNGGNGGGIDLSGGGGGAAGPGGHGGNGESAVSTTGIDGGGGGAGGGDGSGGTAENGGTDTKGFGGDGRSSATSGGDVAGEAGTAGTSGGGAGNDTTATGGAGATGSDWESGVGAGGGGGGSGDSGKGNSGGLYGGGGAGGEDTSALSVGARGIIVITYTPANITVDTTGTQNSPMNSPSNNQYVGGAFTFINTGSTSVSQIIISETDGTLSANTYLSNVILKYKAEASCSASIPGDATVFNAIGVGFDGSDQATVNGDSPMAVGTTTQICIYVQLSVNSGAGGMSFDIAISNPSTEVTVSAGTVSPATAVAISGSTLLQTAVSTVSCSTNVATTSFGTWNDTSIKTSSPNASTTMSCSGTSLGCTLYVKDTGSTTAPGLWKAPDLIESPTAANPSYATDTLSVGAEGYGIQATTTAAGLTIAPRYLQTGDIVGGLKLINEKIASSTADISNAEVIVTHKAAVSENTFSGSYSDTITYECTVN